MSGKTKWVANRAAQALRLAAAALRSSKSALGAYFRRMCSRMDKPKAVAAAAHKLARLIYTMLTKGQEYTDQGQDSRRALPRTRSAPIVPTRPQGGNEAHRNAATGTHLNTHSRSTTWEVLLKRGGALPTWHQRRQRCDVRNTVRLCARAVDAKDHAAASRNEHRATAGASFDFHVSFVARP